MWIAAAASGIPYALHTRAYSYLNHPETGQPIPESVVCTVKEGSMPTVRTMFEASTLVLFVCPIVLITVLYAMIGIKLRVTSPAGRVGRRLTASLIQRQATTVAERRQHKSRSNVIRMLGISLLLLYHHHHTVTIVIIIYRRIQECGVSKAHEMKLHEMMMMKLIMMMMMI